MSTTSIMESKVKAEQRPPQAPTLIFTTADQAASVKVVDELRKEYMKVPESLRLEIFESDAEVAQFFTEHVSNGFRTGLAVVLFDAGVNGCMKHSTNTGSGTGPSIPAWARGTKWGVAVYPLIGPVRVRTVANQVLADYVRNYEGRVEQGQFPWGLPRRGLAGPAELTLPGNVHEVVNALNSGIDFLGDVSPEHAASLPTGSRISCNRVASSAYNINLDYLHSLMDAFEAFEKASHKLVGENASIRQKLLEGVRIDPSVIEAYLYPRNDSFSVRRLDVHLKTPTSVFASENDEMPGGIPQAWWYDRTYEVNQEHWRYALEWLTGRGPLLLLVSHDWSKPYISEMREMAEMLASEGWPVEFLTTDYLDRLAIADDGLFVNGHRVGTIWRQFPIFEVEGELARLVLAAHAGKVEMVPEFAHFGNKSWFSLFREHQDYFQAKLRQRHFDVLDDILPDTALVQSDGSFPAGKTMVGSVRVGSIDELKNLDEKQRNQLVLKVAGANTLSARSHGVLMGHGLNQRTWTDWINDRLRNREPFIVQQAEPTEVRQEAVFNTVAGVVEMFPCRMLLRPWAIGGKTISGAIVGATATTRRVHGMTDMFVVPTDLGRLR